MVRSCQIKSRRWLSLAIVLLPVSYHLHAQPTTYDTVGTIPTVNVGGTYMTSQFARLGFAQMMLEAQKRQAENAAEQRKLIESGTVSALDLQAPDGVIGADSFLSQVDRAPGTRTGTERERNVFSDRALHQEGVGAIARHIDEAGMNGVCRMAELNLLPIHLDGAA